MVLHILNHFISLGFMHLKFILIHSILLHKFHKRVHRKCVVLLL